MAIMCPLACNVCTFDCANHHEYCDAWARGENGTLAIDSNESACVNNANFMMSECATSCGLCHHECVDSKKECAGFAALGECDANPLYMNIHCPVSCGTCKSACKDASGDCPSWSRDGGCVDNPNYMKFFDRRQRSHCIEQTDYRETPRIGTSTAPSRAASATSSWGARTRTRSARPGRRRASATAMQTTWHANALRLAGCARPFASITPRTARHGPRPASARRTRALCSRRARSHAGSARGSKRTPGRMNSKPSLDKTSIESPRELAARASSSKMKLFPRKRFDRPRPEKDNSLLVWQPPSLLC